MEGSEHPLSKKSTHHDTEDDDQSFERSRSLSLQSRRSWPLLPRLQVINSEGSNSNQLHSSNPIRSPVIDSFEQKSMASSDSISSESSICSDYDVNREKDSVYEINHDEPQINDRRRSTVKSNKTRNDSAGTLVEAALDQDEARDRHVQFSAHIAEAGSLVQRMISTRYPSASAATPTATSHSMDHHTIHEASESHHTGDLEMQSIHSPAPVPSYNNATTTGGGSVLASLMKLEAQARRPTVKRRKTIKRKKVLVCRP